MSDNSSIILKLQSDALDESVSVAALLRLAKVVATKLAIPEQLAWINHELDGYMSLSVEELPMYRKLTGTPRAFNPYVGWRQIEFETAEVRKFYSNAPIGMSIASIENSIEDRSGNSTPCFPYPPEIRSRLLNKLEGVTDVQLLLSRAETAGIVDAVRNIILDWSLELENAGIIGAYMSFSEKEKSEAVPVTQNVFAQNVNFITATDHAQVSTVQNSSLNIEQVRELYEKIEKDMSLLPDDIREKIIPLTTEMANELGSPEPDEGKLRQVLGKVREICSNVTENLATRGIIGWVDALIAG